MKLVWSLIAFAVLLLSKQCESTPAPSFKPSKAPTALPTFVPTPSPSARPSGPTRSPTARPSSEPTAKPSNPSAAPSTKAPSQPPSRKPTGPSVQPTYFLSPVPTTPPSSVTTDTFVTFEYTGSEQTFTVPANVYSITVTLVGASGDWSILNPTRFAYGGKGASITSALSVNPGEVYKIFVGGEGKGFTGGYNGGGDARGQMPYCAAGGGGTDFRAYPYGIDDRMIVAGGGGGASGQWPCTGGDGGYPNGLIGGVCPGSPIATSGTQESPGRFGENQGSSPSGWYGTADSNGGFFYGGKSVWNPVTGYGYGGGGGGGYYGGGGAYIFGGGGGSSYSAYPILASINGTRMGNGTASIRYSSGTSAPTLLPTPAAPTIQPTPTPSAIPSANPSATPTAPPSAPPSANPSAVPSATPTAPPSNNPTAVPTAPSPAPSAVPSAAPTQYASAPPSAVPSAVPSAPTVNPTAVPSFVPSAVPSAIPTTVPTAAPSAVPSAVPSAIPTKDPTATPSAIPSATPSAVPTANPTASPSAIPSAMPSAIPTTMPTAAPSAVPSAVPSAIPTKDPTAAPTEIPTVSPSATPTLLPTANPSAIPTASPSAVPTLVPTADPSADPTVSPTADPTVDPTASPTTDPTAQPTAAPTLVPTAAPSAAPTIRPTTAAVKNFELVVDVAQTVYFMEYDNYVAQKVLYNMTIQNTVAAAMDGVTPDRVTNIEVGRSALVGARSAVSSHAGVIATNQICDLKYTVKVYDPVLTVDALRTQLVQAATSGQMDNDLRSNALSMGITELVNGTFSAPLLVNALPQRAASSQLTGAMIAGLVIGVILCLALIATLIFFVVRTHSLESEKEAVPAAV